MYESVRIKEKKVRKKQIIKAEPVVTQLYGIFQHPDFIHRISAAWGVDVSKVFMLLFSHNSCLPFGTEADVLLCNPSPKLTA